MPDTAERTNVQRLADAAASEQMQRWLAAQTVRTRMPAGPEQDELLACLGLADVERPALP
ncbi:MAG TPA: hypothetical protein VM433_13875 [Mycobacteriales bacterium]|nr:hypothetical protein [Mycobacteriales bacterium]